MADWAYVYCCPLCKGKEFKVIGPLFGTHYNFSKILIPLPPNLDLMQCCTCNLLFKSVVPSPEYLAEMYSRASGKIWQDRYTYLPERDLIYKLACNKPFELLDVGPSNGGLLRALDERCVRKSGLDVFQHPGAKEAITGEFIDSLLDSSHFEWREPKFDVVTAFDVCEHFYDAEAAFVNLEKLLKKGGALIVETGDSDSSLPVQFGANNWWYVNMFEHHIFWSEKPIKWMASKYGYELVSIEKKQQKVRMIDPIEDQIKYMWRSFIYRAFTRFASLTKLKQPISPYDKDHVRAILRKN